ncbi:MAG: hypothetical protein A4E19_02720 [Nitrospira sp. SG-bin1]|nr:MAG: hypothetical protein A4E19_02720 [Nitrospira sp. SG-bin1]
MLFFIGTAGAAHFVTVPQVLADEDKNPYPNFKAGQMTGIQGAEIQIDNTSYPMIPSMAITDQYDNPVSLKDISQGARVLFHLDHKGRVDRLVVWIPS